jgi:hypothetical protein
MDNPEMGKGNAVSRRLILVAASVAVAAAGQRPAARAQTPAMPLASWNDGPVKQAILDFVHATTNQSSKTFVPVEDRIATFDQDGTLWVEQPLYTQAVFALYRVHALAPQHPEWQTTEPFKSVLSGGTEVLSKFH